MTTTRKDNDFLNGMPELLLLRLLSRQPMYGYELVQAIKLSTGGVLAFGEGCVYPILHRLEAEGLLLGKRETVNGRSRVVYRLTAAGKRRLGEATTHWERVAAAVNAVLQGGDNEAAAVV
jgi:PadR family transcriptional regulator, regulatory protein PadR